VTEAAAPARGGLDDRREALLAAAWARVDEARLRDWAVTLVATPSPTGEEARLADLIARRLRVAGVEAGTQPIDDAQANAVARVRGDGTGTDLLLYAPIDTLTTGDAAQDVPLVGPVLRDDLRPAPRVDGPYVYGLGAGNPKGHAACVAVAVEAVAGALADTGTTLPGDLLAGFGAGGMPTNRRPGGRGNAGQGNGCAFLLEQGAFPDEAVIAKPGWAVSWEEVGLAWFAVDVHGTHTYVGSRHLLDYRNPIVAATRVIEAIERWAGDYTARHTDGLVAPQVSIGAIESGWPRMPAVTGAVCRLWADVRLSPRTTPAQARREFAALMADLGARHPDLEVGWDMVLAIPGTATPADHPVVAAAARAWERQEGRPHEPRPGLSGATDANILRAHGVPTARIGMPKATELADLDFSLGMNVVDTRQMVRLTRLLVQVAVDRCSERLLS